MVVILQMHSQMKLRRSPCLVFFCCNPEIATNFWAVMDFFSCGCLYLLLDCNCFEWLHRCRFSFIYRSLLLWWPFRLSARHFTDSSLKWSFFTFPNKVWCSGKFLIFFAAYFLRYLWKQNLSHEWVRFFTDDCQLRSRQHWNLCSRVNVDLLYH